MLHCAIAFKYQDQDLFYRLVKVENPPNLYSYSNYRDYLTDWLNWARENRVSNLTRLAKALKVHGSYLAHIFSGSKNLSFEQATDLSELLLHTSLEREYFFALLQIERAGSAKLKNYWLEKKANILRERNQVSARVGPHRVLTGEERAIFYSSWIYLAVFVATGIEGGQTLIQIAQRFQLTPQKAEEILNFLQRTGICVLHSGVYSMGQSVIYLPNDSPHIVKHHTNWRIHGMRRMDQRDDTELFYTAPMSMSHQDFAKIRELLSEAIERSLKICKDSPAEDVYCLNIDLFKVK